MHNMHMHCIWNPEGNILVILMNLAIKSFDLQKSLSNGIAIGYLLDLQQSMSYIPFQRIP